MFHRCGPIAGVAKSAVGCMINILESAEMRLAKYTYRAIGEFHAFGNDINTKVLQLISALAKRYGLLLHVHSDAKAVDNIFSTAPGAMVLCVHSGFDHSEAVGEKAGQA